jgi:hypothetical protein
MSDGQAMEPFETRLAGRVRAYTDPATVRRIDALAISRTAMSSGRATGWSWRRLGLGLSGPRIAGDRWAVAVMAIALIAVVGIALVGRRSDSGPGSQATPAISSPGPATSTGAIPDVLRHAWQRPLPTVPDQVLWPTAFLSLVNGPLEFGPEPGPAASRSAIARVDVDMLAVTATMDTIGCAIGDVGLYRWTLEGKDTVMNLTAVGPDACAAREEALAGQWVRSDFPPPADPEAPLPAGTHQTVSFDPFADPARPGRLSYVVPKGWKVKVDDPVAFVLHHLPDEATAQHSADTFIAVFIQPRMMPEPSDGAACGPSGEAPAVGASVNDLVAAILARPGVDSTAPKDVMIGGFEGQLLDLQLVASWRGSCGTPEGQVVGVPILRPAASETGPVVGITPDQPVRLILLDLTGGRTIAVVVFDLGPVQTQQFEADVAEAMPIIESFDLHPSKP